MPVRRLKFTTLLTVSAIVLSGCAFSNNYTASEQETVEALTPSRFQPASRQTRDNIETQDTLAQAAFWGREYNLNPADLEAAIKLSAAVRRLGKVQRAIEITQTTRAIYPNDPYLSAEHAAALIAAQQNDDAIEVLNAALGQQPNYARLWSLKGAALDQTEKYDLARQHYMRALNITPNDPNIMSNLGLSYALSGDPATAETWLRRATTQPGAGDEVKRNLDLIMQLQGKRKAPVTSGQASPARTGTATPYTPQSPSGYYKPRTVTGQATTPTRPSYAPTQARSTYTGGPGYSLMSNQSGQYKSASEAARAAAQGRQKTAPVTHAMPSAPMKPYAQPSQPTYNAVGQKASPYAYAHGQTPSYSAQKPSLWSRMTGWMQPNRRAPAYPRPAYGAPANPYGNVNMQQPQGGAPYPYPQQRGQAPQQAQTPYPQAPQYNQASPTGPNAAPHSQAYPGANMGSPYPAPSAQAPVTVYPQAGSQHRRGAARSRR